MKKILAFALLISSFMVNAQGLLDTEIKSAVKSGAEGFLYRAGTWDIDAVEVELEYLSEIDKSAYSSTKYKARVKFSNYKWRTYGVTVIFDKRNSNFSRSGYFNEIPPQCLYKVKIEQTSGGFTYSLTKEIRKECD